MLDQLKHFSSWNDPANVANSTYTTFHWYRNMFNVPIGAGISLYKVGPQSCGSLFCTQAQHDTARSFWASVLGDFVRINRAAGQLPLTDLLQLMGFRSQDGNLQVNWFQQVAITMQKYCQFFDGSVTLKSISPVGIGAVAVIGLPANTTSNRNWFYPTAPSLEAFASNRFAPRREIPSNLSITFEHSDPELEEQAEQFAVLAHTNMCWSNLTTQHHWVAINDAQVHTGEYWNLSKFRHSPRINLKTQFAQLIASRYHQQTANRAN